MKKLLIGFICSLFTLTMFAQVPQGINYQTVIRDNTLKPIQGQNVTFRITFTNGVTDAYVEGQSATTDDLGQVHLALGTGVPITGSFAGINWANVSEVQIEFDVDGGTSFQTLGTIELQSVPFAQLAQDVINKDDADADPTNELQVLSFDTMTNILTISQGNSVFIPGGGGSGTLQDISMDTLSGELSITGGSTVNVYDPANLDKDPTNELQDLSMDNSTGDLTISDGNTVNVYDPSNLDKDPTNELQDLAFDTTTNVLTISQGNSVVIPARAAPDQLQELVMDSTSGELTISQGNTVNVFNANDQDQDPENELQTLDFDVNTGDLTISDRNTVNVYDPSDLDKDPTNELQMLVLDTAAGTLTITQGNTVVLPAGSGGGNSPWLRDSLDIFYETGNVGIGRIPTMYDLEVEGMVWVGDSVNASRISADGFSSGDAGGTLTKAYLGMNNLGSNLYTGFGQTGEGIMYVRAGSSDSCCVLAVVGVNETDETGLMELFGSTNNKRNVFLGSALGCSDCGILELYGPDGNPAVIGGASNLTAGYLVTFGSNNQVNTELSFVPGEPNHGSLSVSNDGGQTTGTFSSTVFGGRMQLANPTGNTRLVAGINDSNAGLVLGAGPSGALNFLLTNNGTNPDWGYIGVLNDLNEDVAGMTPAGSGEGFVYARGGNGNLNAAMSSVNNNPDAGFVGVFDLNGDTRAGFFIDNGQGVMFADVKNFRIPHPQDATKEIWYAAIEGDEVGAYTRGVETLENGTRFVAYPDHFAAIIDPNSVTVTLTSHEWDTYGLAVTEKTAAGFTVRELKGGTGNFSFDWEVKAVRTGYEQYAPVREKQQIEADLLPYTQAIILKGGETELNTLPSNR
jgi:hypothetical protein